MKEKTPAIDEIYKEMQQKQEEQQVVETTKKRVSVQYTADEMKVRALLRVGANSGTSETELNEYIKNQGLSDALASLREKEASSGSKAKKVVAKVLSDSEAAYKKFADENNLVSVSEFFNRNGSLPYVEKIVNDYVGNLEKNGTLSLYAASKIELIFHLLGRAKEVQATITSCQGVKLSRKEEIKIVEVDGTLQISITYVRLTFDEVLKVAGTQTIVSCDHRFGMLV